MRLIIEQMALKAESVLISDLLSFVTDTKYCVVL